MWLVCGSLRNWRPESKHSRGQREALTRYIDDGELPISNNGSAKQIWPIVMSMEHSARTIGRDPTHACQTSSSARRSARPAGSKTRSRTAGRRQRSHGPAPATSGCHRRTQTLPVPVASVNWVRSSRAATAYKPYEMAISRYCRLCQGPSRSSNGVAANRSCSRLP